MKRFQATKYVEGTDRAVYRNTHSMGFMAIWIFALDVCAGGPHVCCVPEVVIMPVDVSVYGMDLCLDVDR